MKAMVLTGPSEMGLQDVPTPKPGPNQVLIRVTRSGICGTDYKIYTGAIPVRYPRIMGHEMIGVIADANGSEFRTGQRVIVDPELYCGACFHCRVGQTHLCPKGQLLGRDSNGGFAEFLAAPLTQVFALPDEVDDQVAPLIQVFTTCLHAQRLTPIFAGESVAVLGLGVTGQLHAQLAKVRGAKPVIGVTRSADKRALAEKLGADITFPGGPESIEKVRSVTSGRGADVVIDTTGMLPVIADGIQMVRPGGRLLLFGIITAKEGALPFYNLYFKEIQVINARVAKAEDFPASIELVQKGQVKLLPLISDVMPFAELKSAIGMLGSDGGSQRMKILMDHS
jgi:2-desacetyl-2-hydroxyethyl bacteriochlorophyllide A dehydrogenase